MKMGSDGVVCRFPVERDLEGEPIGHLCELINRVYDEAESVMWQAIGTRTRPAEVEELLRMRALILAEHRGAVVGERLHPDKVPQLATPCDLTVWHKRL